MTEHDEFSKFYDEVYSQDFPNDSPSAHIQWKGTQPCIDLHCLCGASGHIDADFFFYYYECAKCKRRYALGDTIKLIELTKEQSDHVEEYRGSMLLTDESVLDEEDGV